MPRKLKYTFLIILIMYRFSIEMEYISELIYYGIDTYLH